jgi:sodium transport system permease protein
MEHWRQVRILYAREVRAAFRERSIVLNSILIPVFLYPFLLWAVLSGLMFVMGQTEGLRSRVVVKNWPAGHPGLRRKLEMDQHIDLVASKQSTSVIEEKLRIGTLDLLVEFLPAEDAGSALPNNFIARLTSNDSKESSVEARDRVSSLIARYRSDWLKRDARTLGISDADWQVFGVDSVNVASKKEMGAFLFGLLAPVIFVVMVAMGCFYPAVDSIAGERERNTWETLMSSAVSRRSMVLSKYLYVVTFGGMAGVLNLLAIMATIRPIFGPLLARGGRTLEANIPLLAIPFAFLGALLLAAFVGAAMMIFASFARTFKEGQAMVTPFYMLILVPVVFLQAPGLNFSWKLALVPIVNITLMLRETFSGKFQWSPILITIIVSLLFIWACLRLAAYILKFEDVLIGSYNASFGRFIRQRMFPRAAKI